MIARGLLLMKPLSTVAKIKPAGDGEPGVAVVHLARQAARGNDKINIFQPWLACINYRF